MIAVGINAGGGREVVGLQICSERTAPAGGLALAARRLAGIRILVSDAQRGLVGAIGAVGVLAMLPHPPELYRNKP